MHVSGNHLSKAENKHHRNNNKQVIDEKVLTAITIVHEHDIDITSKLHNIIGDRWYDKK
jgi:hypothetical protein